MINIYTKNNQVIKYTENDDIETLDAASILWIDLLNPSAAEISKISDGFEVEFPTRQERESIESSSRYWEDSDSISINALFFVSFFFADKAKDHCNESVAFIIKNEILFTMRYKG